MVALFIFAWVSGERIAYIALIVFTTLPVVSVFITVIALLGLKVRQKLPETVTKNQESFLKVAVKNCTPFPLAQVEFRFEVNEYVFDMPNAATVALASFKDISTSVAFYARYRGRYKAGLSHILATDFMGLVTLKRKYKAAKKITVLPQIFEIFSTPLALNLLAESNSAFDIKDEDYAVISDVRPYVPTDSIKRVHWKLTAKRNEWLVKQFQSNGLNSVDIILDTRRLPFLSEELLQLEDEIVESGVALARFCLTRSMPVDFYTTEGVKTRAPSFAFFDAVYRAASEIAFAKEQKLDLVSVLSGVINEAAGFVNAVIITSNLDVALYEKVVIETSKGNFVAVIFIKPSEVSEEKDRIFEMLEQGGLPVFLGVLS